MLQITSSGIFAAVLSEESGGDKVVERRDYRRAGKIYKVMVVVVVVVGRCRGQVMVLVVVLVVVVFKHLLYFLVP